MRSAWKCFSIHEKRQLLSGKKPPNTEDEEELAETFHKPEKYLVEHCMQNSKQKPEKQHFKNKVLVLRDFSCNWNAIWWKKISVFLHLFSPYSLCVAQTEMEGGKLSRELEIDSIYLQRDYSSKRVHYSSSCTCKLLYAHRDYSWKLPRNYLRTPSLCFLAFRAFLVFLWLLTLIWTTVLVCCDFLLP